MMTAVSFLGNLALARLLSPVEFGDFTVAASVALLIYMVAGFGSQEALIQYRGEDETEVVATAFWVSIGVGVVLAVVSVLIGVVVQQLGWYDNTISTLVIALSIIYFGRICSTTLGTLLQRDLNHQPIAVIFAVSKVLSFTIAVIAAWRGAGIWALFIREAIEILVNLIGLLYANQTIPKFGFTRAALNHLLRFGSRILVVRVSETVYGRVDNLLVERLFGSAALGSYGMAYRLSQLGHELTYQTIGSVMFSAFATIQSSKERLKVGFERSTYWLIRFALLVSLVAFAAGEEVTVLLYGEPWREAGKLLVWMTPFIFFLPLYSNNRMLLEAIGLLNETIYASLIKAAVFVLGLLVFPRFFGLAGVVLTVHLSMFTGWLLLSYYIGRHLLIDWLHLGLRPFFALIVTGGYIVWWGSGVDLSFGRILITIFTTIAVYLLSLVLFEYKLLVEEANTIKRIASK